MPVGYRVQLFCGVVPPIIIGVVVGFEVVVVFELAVHVPPFEVQSACDVLWIGPCKSAQVPVVPPPLAVILILIVFPGKEESWITIDVVPAPAPTIANVLSEIFACATDVFG